MGRPLGSKNKAKIIAPASEGVGHNSANLTDEQMQALFFQHKQRYETALARKKAADADLRN